MAFASPGVDEVAVVTRLIADLHQSSGVARPIRLAFHVGITRIEGEEFGGEAALRTRALLLDPAILAAVPGNGQELTVIMSEGLYSDLRAEGMPGHGWRRIPAASAWMRSCEASRPGAVGCADEAGRRESSSG